MSNPLFTCPAAYRLMTAATALLLLCLAFNVSAMEPESIKGEWSFVFYERVAGATALMPPPPVFDAFDILDESHILLRFNTKASSITADYTLEDDVISFQFTMPERAEPVPFKARLRLQPEEHTLTLHGRNSDAVYLRSEDLKPPALVAGNWQTQGRHQETLSLGRGGEFAMLPTRMAGVFRLWPSKKTLTMTLIAKLPSGVWCTFLWEITQKDDTLTMVPINAKGPQKKKATVWKRCLELKPPEAN